MNLAFKSSTYLVAAIDCLLSIFWVIDSEQLCKLESLEEKEKKEICILILGQWLKVLESKGQYDR